MDLYQKMLTVLNGPNAAMFVITFIIMFVIASSLIIAFCKNGRRLGVSIIYGISASPLVFIVFSILSMVLLKIIKWIFPVTWLRFVEIPSLCLLLAGIIWALIEWDDRGRKKAVLESQKQWKNIP